MRLIVTGAMWKVNSAELLTEQAMRKKMLYTKNMYILMLLLNIVTIRNEAHVIQGNKFLYACVKAACHL
jgi:hypothetical protein